MTNLEMFIGNKSLNVKHCPVELSQKTFMANPEEREEYHPTAKYLLIFPTKKIP